MRRLYVGGLSHKVTEKDLKDRFGKFGEVEDVELRTRRDEEGVPYKTFGYINISISDSDLKKCMTVLNKSKWKGGTLQIETAKESFLHRLAEERQAAADQRLQPPATDPRQELLESFSRNGVENFTMKAAVPGTEVPGHKDWVVSKFGRVLPVLQLCSRRGSKSRSLKIDPSKFSHNIRRLDRGGEAPPPHARGKPHLAAEDGYDSADTDELLAVRRKPPLPPLPPPLPLPPLPPPGKRRQGPPLGVLRKRRMRMIMKTPSTTPCFPTPAVWRKEEETGQRGKMMMRKRRRKMRRKWKRRVEAKNGEKEASEEDEVEASEEDEACEEEDGEEEEEKVENKMEAKKGENREEEASEEDDGQKGRRGAGGRGGLGPAPPRREEAELQRRANQKEEAELQRRANQRRLAAVQQRQQEAELQRRLIQGALRRRPPLQRQEKHIVFGSDSEEEEEEERKRKKSLGEEEEEGGGEGPSRLSGPRLFGDEEEAGEEEDGGRFDIRPQFEGRAGQKLMALQSRFGTDERFRMDSRFLEEEEKDEEEEAERKRSPEEEEEEEEGGGGSGGGEEEDSVHPGRRPGDQTHARQGAAVQGRAALHYDPTKEEHSAFETRAEETRTESKSARRRRREEAQRLPEVSKEIYYDLSGDLRAAFGEGGGGRKGGGAEEEEEEEEEEPPKEEEEEPQGFRFSFFGDEADAGGQEKTEYKVENIAGPKVSWQTEAGSSSEEEEEEEEQEEEEEEEKKEEEDKEEETISTSVTQQRPPPQELFFFCPDDARLAEGSGSFCRLEEDRDQWEERRTSLRQEYRKKHKDARRKLTASSKS
ncbi:LOW QUALITY PROTEIN: nucleolar protein 8 [Menidia menidia]